MFNQCAFLKLCSHIYYTFSLTKDISGRKESTAPTGQAYTPYITVCVTFLANK